MVGETVEMARAARRRGGSVIANVGTLVEEGYGRVHLPAEMIDAVVYHPDTEQTAGIPHRRHWPALTTESEVPIGDALAEVALVNRLVGVGARSDVDAAVARLAADTLVAHVGPGAHVNVGTGLPEQVCAALFDAGLHDSLTLLVESGPIGGLPASGIYFGAAFSPRRIVSSAEMFRLCAERLDATCLGALEVDGDGNVNVSRRGEGPLGLVGPGGFIDLAAAARVVVFVSDWMVQGRFAVEGGRVRLAERGAPKLVERVREITFDGRRALALGKRVFWATPVGLFELTAAGVALRRVMPGIDVRRDVLGIARAPIVVPEGSVPLVRESVVTGDGFAPVLGR
jgi:propionate CoA-transferase